MHRLVLALAALLPLAACQSGADTPADHAEMDHANMDHGGMDHGTTALSSYTDLRFLDGMIHHHEMAIEMAREVEQRGTQPDVQALAADILRSQSAEIDTMRAWRARWFADATAPGPMTADAMAAMGMAMPMDSLTTAPLPDRPFLDLMLPHHAGAIVMAGEAIAYTERPAVRALARQIIRAQAEEIGDMQRLLDTLPER